MSGHSKEPWSVGPFAGHASSGDRLVAACNGHFNNTRGEEVDNENHANAARIVSCVNALAGLNPDAVAGLVEAANALLDDATTPDDPMSDSCVQRRYVDALAAALSALEAGR